MAYICSVCEKEHDALPRDMVYHRPADYFEVGVKMCFYDTTHLLL